MTDQGKTIFLSRAGRDKDFAAVISEILKGAGYSVIVQDETFGRQSFVNSMHEALASDARVVGLLSPEWLDSAYCQAEWQAAIADDPLNRKERLVVMRVADCPPKGLLQIFPYVDLWPIRDKVDTLAEVVRASLVPGSRLSGLVSQFWRAPTTLRNAASRSSPRGFFARQDHLSQATDYILTSLSDPAPTILIVSGMGGVGKSSFTRATADRVQDHFGIVWEVNAQTEDSLVAGLLDLGAEIIPDIRLRDDPKLAARQVLDLLISGLERPLLLILDNIESEEVLYRWLPPKNATVLVTSRISNLSVKSRRVFLEELTVEAACDLLSNLLSDTRPDLSHADLARLARALDGLPLALTQAAARLQSNRALRAATYLEGLEAALHAIPELSDYPKSVMATFLESVDEAERQAPFSRLILQYAAHLSPSGVSLQTIREIAARPTGYQAEIYEKPNNTEVTAALGLLDRLSLIDINDDGQTYNVHRLVQRAARHDYETREPAWSKLNGELHDEHSKRRPKMDVHNYLYATLQSYRQGSNKSTSRPIIQKLARESLEADPPDHSHAIELLLNSTNAGMTEVAIKAFDATLEGIRKMPVDPDFREFVLPRSSIISMLSRGFANVLYVRGASSTLTVLDELYELLAEPGTYGPITLDVDHLTDGIRPIKEVLDPVRRDQWFSYISDMAKRQKPNPESDNFHKSSIYHIAKMQLNLIGFSLFWDRPEDASYWLGRLEELLGTDLIPPAVDRYGKAASLDPWHLSLADILLKLGLRERAEHHISQVESSKIWGIPIGSDEAGYIGTWKANYQAAESYLRLGRVEEAKSAFREAHSVLEHAVSEGWGSARLRTLQFYSLSALTRFATNFETALLELEQAYAQAEAWDELREPWSPDLVALGNDPLMTAALEIAERYGALGELSKHKAWMHKAYSRRFPDGLSRGGLNDEVRVQLAWVELRTLVLSGDIASFEAEVALAELKALQHLEWFLPQRRQQLAQYELLQNAQKHPVKALGLVVFGLLRVAFVLPVLKIRRALRR